MKTLHLVDPDVREIAASFPPLSPTIETLPAFRETVLSLYPSPNQIKFEEHFASSGVAGSPDVRVLLHRPKSADGASPAIFYLHGGGFIAGKPDMMAVANAELAEMTGAVVIAVQYRLAPETSFPGPVEDCYAALNWVDANADDLGIDRDRIVIYGQSAGGGLAAATALLARDRGGPALKAQFLLYPMLDARTATPREPVKNPTTGEFGWTVESNRFAWQAMRGGQDISSEQLGYFSPAQASDFSGLPQTFLAVGSLDLFFEENIAFVQGVSRAGVSIEAHIYPGGIHGFEMFPGTLAGQYRHAFLSAIHRVLS